MSATDPQRLREGIEKGERAEEWGPFRDDYRRAYELHAANDYPALARVVEEWRAALEAIAADDELVAANEDAFSVHAYRRCREIARAALAAGSATETREE